MITITYRDGERERGIERERERNNSLVLDLRVSSVPFRIFFEGSFGLAAYLSEEKTVALGSSGFFFNQLRLGLRMFPHTRDG